LSALLHFAIELLPQPQPRSHSGNIDIQKPRPYPSCRATVILPTKLPGSIDIG